MSEADLYQRVRDLEERLRRVEATLGLRDVPQPRDAAAIVESTDASGATTTWWMRADGSLERAR